MRNAATVAGAIGVAVLLKGCVMSESGSAGGPVAGPVGGRVLLDHQGGTTGRPHCTTVGDPFGGGGGKVIHGEVVEKGFNKTTFLNNAGFFVVPPAGRGEVVVRYAVRKEPSLRVALVADTGSLKSYYFQAPALEAWCEAVLPLGDLSPRVNPGEKIVDISIWQQGGGKEGGLWIDWVKVRGE